MMTVVPSDLTIWTWTAGATLASCGSNFVKGSEPGGSWLSVALKLSLLVLELLLDMGN